MLTTTLSDPHGYGRILRTQDNEVMAIVEQTDATPSQRGIREVNTGVYAFDITALRSALSRLSSDNAQQELYLTDVIAILRRDGHTVSARHVDDSALVAGVNNRVQLAQLGAELNRRIVAAHQMAGVTVIDPPPRGSTSTSRSGAIPSSTPAPSCWAEPRSAATAS
ncbi:bifunctional glmU domain protein [Mycobacterium kansasii]|uniref:Bifunctional glmU domain protein n=1 Tax=Mycobacterium kansasii TaxID=1768 RepID=A0A1V3XIU7_MYCKA|nr:bifunctional glmU domain protein [Mycobacterium kansasii]